MACDFMETIEKKGGPLDDILTAGGLDGLIDEKAIEVSDTKTLKTKKGDIQVGNQLSDCMSKKLIEFIDNFKGELSVILQLIQKLLLPPYLQNTCR